MNQGKPLRDLEKETGGKWRKYPGGRQKWCSMSCVYREVERLVAEGADEPDAIASVQATLDAIPKRGKSTKPDIAGLVKQLRKRRAEEREQIETV